MPKHAYSNCPAKCPGLVKWRFIVDGQDFLAHILPQKESPFSRILHSHQVKSRFKVADLTGFCSGKSPGSYLSFPQICNPQGDHRGRNVPHIYQSMFRPAKEDYTHKYNKIHFQGQGFGISFMICIYVVLPNIHYVLQFSFYSRGIHTSNVTIWNMSELMS